MASFLDKNGVTRLWVRIKEFIFSVQYELSNSTVVINRDSSGKIASISETRNNATTTTVFSGTDPKVITETIIPVSGSYKYVKTTVIPMNLVNVVTTTEKVLK